MGLGGGKNFSTPLGGGGQKNFTPSWGGGQKKLTPFERKSPRVTIDQRGGVKKFRTRREGGREKFVPLLRGGQKFFSRIRAHRPPLLLKNEHSLNRFKIG